MQCKVTCSYPTNCNVLLKMIKQVDWSYPTWFIFKINKLSGSRHLCMHIGLLCALLHLSPSTEQSVFWTASIRTPTLPPLLYWLTASEAIRLWLIGSKAQARALSNILTHLWKWKTGTQWTSKSGRKPLRCVRKTLCAKDKSFSLAAVIVSKKNVLLVDKKSRSTWEKAVCGSSLGVKTLTFQTLLCKNPIPWSRLVQF